MKNLKHLVSLIDGVYLRRFKEDLRIYYSFVYKPILFLYL